MFAGFSAISSKSRARIPSMSTFHIPLDRGDASIVDCHSSRAFGAVGKLFPHPPLIVEASGMLRGMIVCYTRTSAVDRPAKRRSV